MKKNRIAIIVVGVFVFLFALLHFVVEYLDNYYVVNFEMVVAVLGNEIRGADSNVALNGVKYVVPRVAFFY